MAGRLQREKRQAALFNNLREYVYYPGSFRPFALLTQQEGYAAATTITATRTARRCG
ncbi:hypothetical protein GGER_46120 [Serratia rubidaea]